MGLAAAAANEGVTETGVKVILPRNILNDAEVVWMYWRFAAAHLVKVAEA